MISFISWTDYRKGGQTFWTVLALLNREVKGLLRTFWFLLIELGFDWINKKQMVMICFTVTTRMKLMKSLGV